MIDWVGWEVLMQFMSQLNFENHYSVEPSLYDHTCLQMSNNYFEKINTRTNCEWTCLDRETSLEMVFQRNIHCDKSKVHRENLRNIVSNKWLVQTVLALIYVHCAQCKQPKKHIVNSLQTGQFLGQEGILIMNVNAKSPKHC